MRHKVSTAAKVGVILWLALVFYIASSPALPARRASLIVVEPSLTTVRSAQPTLPQVPQDPPHAAASSSDTPAAQETILSSQLPQHRSQRWGVPQELGTRFSPTVDGLITAVRVYGAETESGEHDVRIWRWADASLVAGPYSWEYAGAGWHELALPTPIHIQANTDYIVAVSTGTDAAHDFVSTVGGFDEPVVNHHLATYTGSGVRSSHMGDMPTWPMPDSRNTFRDVVFVPDGNAHAVDPTPARADASTYYVATNGNNAWSGTLPAPNSQDTDGPWRTIQHAATQTGPGDTIYVRGGTYHEWVWLESSDSGTEAAPKTFAAYPGETPTLDGAVYPTAWQLYSGHIWQVDASNIDFNWEGQARLVWEDDVWLRHADSLASMAAGTWWYNTSTHALYVWPHAGDDPHAHQIAVMSLRNGFHLNVASWITINGLRMVHYYRAIDQSDSVVNQGRSMEGLTVRNCTIEHVGEGVGLAGNTFEMWGFTHRSLIENNVIRDTQSDAVWVGSGAQHVVRGNTIFDVKQAWYRGFVSAAIIVGDAGDSVVERNVVHDFHALGIDVEHYNPGQYGSRNVIRRNLVYAAGQHAIAVLGANDTQIENNVIYDVTTFAILINTESGPALRNRIVNNTVYDSADRGIAIIHGSSPGVFPQDTVIRNNIFSNISYVAIENQGSNTSADYNLYWHATGGLAVWITSTYTTLAGLQGIGQETHGQVADPAFVSPGVSFALAENSPAIDAASNADAPSTDFVGVARPLDGNGDGIVVADIGAYEWWLPSAYVYLPLILKSYGVSP